MNAFTVGKRRSAVFSMQRSTTASSAGGTGAAWLGRGGGASRCWRSMSVIVSARNGYCPVSRW